MPEPQQHQIQAMKYCSSLGLMIFRWSDLKASKRKSLKFSREILFFFLNWSIVDLQHCVNFCCTAKWLSYTHTHTHTYIYNFSQSFPLWFVSEYWIEFSVLYSRTLLFAQSIYNSLHLLILVSQSVPPPSPLPWQPQVCSLICESVSFPFY